MKHNNGAFGAFGLDMPTCYFLIALELKRSVGLTRDSFAFRLWVAHSEKNRIYLLAKREFLGSPCLPDPFLREMGELVGMEISDQIHEEEERNDTSDEPLFPVFLFHRQFLNVCLMGIIAHLPFPVV